jgi:hypothetical protein
MSEQALELLAVTVTYCGVAICIAVTTCIVAGIFIGTIQALKAISKEGATNE